jgi:Peptidase A4 family
MTAEDDKHITETRPPLRYTVPPGIQTPIAVKTLPEGICTVRLDTKPTMKLYADKDGIIRIFVSSTCPEPEESGVLKFVIDCDKDGNVTAFPIELRVSSTPTPDMPSPPSDLPRPSARTKTLPALSEEDMMRLSNKELIERGYPFRPHHEKQAKAFESWKKFVSRPITVIEPHIVPRTDRHSRPPVIQNHLTDSPLPSINWAGVQMGSILPNGGLIGPFDLVQGEYVIPWFGVKPPPPVGTSKYVDCALWVGIDLANIGPSHMWQSGIEISCTAVSEGNGCILVGAMPQPWYEITPQLPVEPIGPGTTAPGGQGAVVNFTLDFGDNVTIAIYTESHLTGGPFPGSFVRFDWSVDNPYPNHIQIRPIYFRKDIPLTGVSIAGATAEWILEKPRPAPVPYFDPGWWLMFGHAWSTATESAVQPSTDNTISFMITDDGSPNSEILVSPTIETLPSRVKFIKFVWLNEGTH